jgi:ABC-type transport system involved in multi-copper enzyme maturation permease subunit
VVIVVGIWLALGLRSGLWGTGFLLGIFVLTLQFAIFYAVSTLLAVLTRSPIVCILGCALVYLVLWGIPAIGGLVKPFHEMKVTPAWVYDTLDVTRKSLPRYKDLDALNSMLIAGDLLAKDSELRKVREKQANEINWWASMGITFGYIAACLGLACWLFSMKDY